MSRIKKRLIAVGIVVAALAIAYGPIANAVMAVRLLLCMQSLSSGRSGQELPVLVTKVTRRYSTGNLDALVYRRDGFLPSRAVVLIPGVSELGCYHPRLMAFSRTIADKGFLILTPDIRKFRQFEIPPEAIDQFSFWFAQLPTLEGGEKLRCFGLSGISFAGTMALIAAARPEIRDKVSFVLAIGAYDDPLRCTRAWFAPGPVTVSEGYYPTRFYAKWIIMISALEMLADQEERRFVRSVLEDLLLGKKAPTAPAGLSADGRRWYRLAIMREDQSDPDLVRSIEEYLMPRLYRPMTPDRVREDLRCSVFFVHGAHDDLIPPDESCRLQERFGKSRSYLLISPFLTHTHPLAKSLTWSEKAKGVTDAFVFFYNLARVVR